MEFSTKKIWFTGSHGTGKTTQMRLFNSVNPEYSILEMERRDLHEKGIINLNKRVNPSDEVIIAGNVMLSIMSKSAPFISDRSWICKCAYSQACAFPQELLDAWHVINTTAFYGVENTEAYIYFPPMFSIEDDGVRSVDPEYQKEIDLLIRFYLDLFEIDYYTLTAETVQDRHFEIEEYLKSKK